MPLEQLALKFLAPLIGALLAWFGAHGLTIVPGAQDVLLALAASGASVLWHLIETRLGLFPPPPPSPPSPPSGGSVVKALAGLFALSVVLGALPGCASFGLAPAQSTAERFGYAYGALVGALNTVANEITDGALSREEGAAVNQDLMAVSTELDQARQILCGTDTRCATPAATPAGLTALAAATATLTQISSYLTCRAQPKGATCPLP